MQNLLKPLLDRAAEIQIELKAIDQAALAAQRDLTEAEQSQWDALIKEQENLGPQIQRARQREDLRIKDAAAAAQRAKDKPTSEEAKIKKRFSLMKVLRSAARQAEPDGLEGEMHQEAIREAQRSGISISGVGIPYMIKRDLTVGTDTAGGHTVETELGDLIPYLRPRLLLEQLGATVLDGLSGNLTLPRQDGASSGSWEGEQDAGAESSASFDTIALTPNRVGAYMNASKQLLAQSSISVENFMRGDLETAIRIAVDAAGINGSGSGNQPTGILNTAGIGSVALGANGAALTFGAVVDLESEVAVDNADMGRLAYLTTPGARGKAKQTLLDAGSGQFIWAQGAQELNGYSAFVSTQVPSNLTKGSGTSLHAMIFGNFQDLILASWSGLDVVVDPYSLATTASVRIIVNSWWDVAVRHAESFAAISDIDIS